MLAINGRFEVRPVTGVERYAREVSMRIKGITETIRPSTNANGLAGHLWEQLVLPSRVGNRPLWSPCNSGPIATKRQVITIHDCAVLDHPEWFSRTYSMLYGMLWPELASKAAAIITVSNHAKSRLLERLKISESKVSVVRNGVSQKFRPADAEGVHLMRQRLGIPPGPYILSVCSNEPRKNLSTLLTAWASIASKHVGVTLVLSGALGNKNVFRSQQVNALPDNTIVTGYVEEELLPALYSGASCFVYPSLYEGFGLPVLEAHACGVPVVTSDQTSLKEIAGPAHLIDPRSPADIASTILKVMDAGQTTENSKIARSHASKFTWDQCASETESLLLSIAS